MNPQASRILCLDVGDRRIGIAVSDPLGITAQPLDTYTRVGYGPDVRHISALALRYETDRVLCGLPRNMDGSQGGQAEKVRAFAAELEKAGMRISYWDERMTTVTAERALIEGGMRREQRKQKVDMVAAVVILQAYLDAGGLFEGQAEANPRDLNPSKSIQSEGNTMDDQRNGMNEETEEMDDLVELVDEEGNPVQFRHMMTLEHKGNEYVLLCGVEDEDDEEASEVYILQISHDANGEDCYITVEDEDLMQEVFDKFVEIAEQDEEDGEDSDEE